MKRFLEALVMTEMVVAILAMAIVGVQGTARAQAASPVVTLSGEAVLRRSGSTGSPSFHVDATFTTDTPEAEPFTVQRAIVYFPDAAGTNGRLFPSCDARRIERWHGDVRRCPAGSKIGSGSVKARAIQIGVTATGRVTMFNSRRGKAVTFNVQTYLPAYINRSFDAPLTQLHGGRFGEKLTLTVPHSLQEILAGVFVGVQDFDVTLSGAVRRRGVVIPYVKATTCPKRTFRGVFDFKDWTTAQSATVTADAKVRCTLR